MSGTVAQPTGITDPPIDDLLQKTDSKYALVLYSAKRARQINAYYAQLNEGLLEYVGPLQQVVDGRVGDARGVGDGSGHGGLPTKRRWEEAS